MTDIVERLRNADLTLILPDGSIKYVNHVAADEIERLREALKRLAELDEFVCGKPQTIEEVMNYTQFVARAALGEKE